MKDLVILKFTGQMVDILCKPNPKYKEFIVMDGGTPVIYVCLIKAIYGCVKLVLFLWYKTFSRALQQMLGFVLIPYNRCVANCDIQGKQCTIAWYMDVMKISHEDPDVVTMMIINKLEGVWRIWKHDCHTRILPRRVSGNDHHVVHLTRASYSRDHHEGLSVQGHQ